MTRSVLPLLRLLLATVAMLAGTSASAAALDAQMLAGLAEGSFATKAEAVEALANSGAPRADLLLSALLDGRLFTRRDNQQVVVASTQDDPAPLADALSGDALPAMPKSELKKIAINNTLRGNIRVALAKLGLANPSTAARIAAAQALAADLSPATLGLVTEALAREQDPAARKVMETLLALGDLQSDDLKIKLAAIPRLGGSMMGEVRNQLATLSEAAPSATASADEIAVHRAAAAAVRDIDRLRARYELVETLFFGLSLGFVLVLAAAGLAITFGVMGVINMAHGELMMIGAYTTYVVQLMMPAHLELSLLVAIPCAFLTSGLTGIAIERGVVRFLYGRPLETLLATFGISLFLQQVARSVFTPLNRNVQSPAWMSGQWVLDDALSLTMNRVCIIAFSVLVFAALQALLRFTPLGLQVRAVSQNRAMARALGVRANVVDALTFGLGSGVAGLAGVALSQLTNVGPNLGQAYIIDSFMVVVFGGVGNLWGTLVAGLSLGVANKFLEPHFGAVLAKILVLVFIILFIQRRPRGLFPQRGRAAEG